MNCESRLRDALTGKRVFLTGNTGFKGSWLTCWLRRYGCQVSGYALPPESAPSLFSLAKLQDQLEESYFSDIRNSSSLNDAVQKSEPEIVIHLAAQPLVRRSYFKTEETWSTNVMGTVNLFESIRSCSSVKAVLIVTTDKCYDNREWVWGYRETDQLGGHDPYSASKSATELVTHSYRKSFFGDRGPLVASARAGNVIGGGDWSEDRLIPDAVRAVEKASPLVIRSPNATRPWQHVLDCLSGYLLLVAKLVQGEKSFATAFNFGPSANDNIAVGQLLNEMQSFWPELDWTIEPDATRSRPHEAGYLYLDSSLSRQKLEWAPRWTVPIALRKTIKFYQAIQAGQTPVMELMNQQIDDYLNYENTKL